MLPNPLKMCQNKTVAWILLIFSIAKVILTALALLLQRSLVTNCADNKPTDKLEQDWGLMSLNGPSAPGLVTAALPPAWEHLLCLATMASPDKQLKLLNAHGLAGGRNSSELLVSVPIIPAARVRVTQLHWWSCIPPTTPSINWPGLDSHLPATLSLKVGLMSLFIFLTVTNWCLDSIMGSWVPLIMTATRSPIGASMLGGQWRCGSRSGETAFAHIFGVVSMLSSAECWGVSPYKFVSMVNGWGESVRSSTMGER